MIGIYKITSPSNRIYIGQSINIDKRFEQYKNLRCKKQIALYHSFLKYGVENHIFEIICECNEIELNNLERFYQDLFFCVGKKGMNLRLTKADDRNGEMSEETKNKMSNNNAKFWLGKKRCDITKKKISNKLKGSVISDDIRLKMSKNNTKFWLGKKLNNEHKEKLSLAKIGKKSNCSRLIIDVSNGVFYDSLREASKIYDIKETTLCMQLKNINRNKTNLRYA